MALHTTSPTITDDAVYDTSSFISFTVYRVTAPGTGTPNVQVSFDGNQWYTVGPFNASGYLTVGDIAARVRIHGGSGTPGAYIIRALRNQDGG